MRAVGHIFYQLVVLLPNGRCGQGFVEKETIVFGWVRGNWTVTGTVHLSGLYIFTCYDKVRPAAVYLLPQ